MTVKETIFHNVIPSRKYTKQMIMETKWLKEGIWLLKLDFPVEQAFQKDNCRRFILIWATQGRWKVQL